MHDGPLFWTLHGNMPPEVRVERLGRLRALTEERLGLAEARVIALKHRLGLIDSALSDYMLGGKQEGS